LIIIKKGEIVDKDWLKDFNDKDAEENT